MLYDPSGGEEPLKRHTRDGLEPAARRALPKVKWVAQVSTLRAGCSG